MELALFFYFAEVSSNLAFILLAMGIIGAIIWGITTINAFMNADYAWNTKQAKAATHERFKASKGVPIACVIAIVVSCLLPSKDTMYTMAATYGVQSVAENSNVQRLAGKSLQVLESKLDEYLKEDKK
ncbi:hypothetical protein [Citrobacter phage CVT22]|uniref:Uncharacterized protein n=1 Tax=Citrobacter phage CVT22 TaxID=1622234 RepID=A0A0R6BA68_9CAUD|nr:hypothetical protein APL39_gp73 [Citrobacter phage CVT22]AJT60776.1 hypothetical protein [Citrobacter phage CVT22]